MAVTVSGPAPWAVDGDGDCPICGQPRALDQTWHEQKRAELEQLQQAAKEARDARSAAHAAIASAQRLIATDTQTLAKAQAEDALREAAAEARTRAETSQPKPRAGALTPEALADALETNAGDLREALDRLKTTAAGELAKREDAWRPFAAQIAQWLPKARQAREAAASLAELKKAEKWLKDTADAIRADRFSPIEGHAKLIWDRLKLQCNVSLEHVGPKGDPKSTQRRVDLEVKVDGQEGAARAPLPASPFRFIVIDDPVQSMDPARVLHEAAKDRQVVVFTNDDRLPESVRRLDIQATVIEVTRADNSQVTTRPALTPVSRPIADAMALAQDKDLSPEIARRVIRGLCRQALEAACMEAVRRRRIGRGESHRAVEELLLKAGRLTNLVALALFDDNERAGDVPSRLNKESKACADTFRAVNEGSHTSIPGDLLDVILRSEKVAAWMQKLA